MTLYTRTDGPPGAPPLLLLHGGPGAHHDYLYPQCLALAAHHRLVTYDQRGGGRSRTDEPAPIGWRTHVDDLAAVARAEQVTPLSLVGYSWGALLALLYYRTAVLEPDPARPVPARLVLIAPAPITRAWRAAFEDALAERQRAPAIAALRAELAASGLRERDPAAHRQRAFELSVAGYFADPARATQLTPFRVTGKVQQATWDSLGDYDLRDDLARARRAVPVPAIVLHGRQDPIPVASAEALATLLGAEFVPIEGCGHVPYVERPAELFPAIDRFLARTT